MVLIMLQGLFFVVSFAALIGFVYDDYATSERLNNTADNIIEDVNMPDSDKLENLSFLYRNCMMFSERSIFFKRRYEKIAVKIQQVL